MALAICLLGLVFFVACDQDEAKLAKIEVSLVDDPALYDAVLIDIKDVQVNISSEDSSSGWQSLNGTTPGIYDLLQLTNGVEAFMGDIELAEGRLGQIRLILGDQNSVVVEGDTKELKVPSGSQSGLKVKVNEDIEGGTSYKLIVDFDAGKSVVKAGNSGKFILKPVLRASLEVNSGSISGVICPDSIGTVVYGIMGADTASTYPDENGNFVLWGLPVGSYTVIAVPDSTSGYSSAIVDSVEVLAGEFTNVDTLKLTN